jgi:hypothetical protein
MREDGGIGILPRGHPSYVHHAVFAAFAVDYSGDMADGTRLWWML